MSLKMRHREEMATAETAARKLARSGQYHSYSTIRHELLTRGYFAAQKIFRNPWTIAEIDRICASSRNPEQLVITGTSVSA